MGAGRNSASSYPEFDDYNLVVESLRLPNKSIQGNIPDSFYLLIDKLLSINSEFEWDLSNNPDLGNPLPDDFTNSYPNLARRMAEQPSLIEKLGGLSCYPQSPEFEALFQGNEWVVYSCSSVALDCPDPNTGPEAIFGNPINSRTCNKHETTTDYSAPGVSPLKISRTYNSRKYRGWRFNSISKELSVSGNYVKVQGRGRGNYLFVCNYIGGSGNCSSKPMKGSTHTPKGFRLRTTEDGFEFVLPSGAIEKFSLEGKLVAKTTVTGHSVYFSYNNNQQILTDEFGHSVILNLDSDDPERVLSASTPIGTFFYEYDEYKRLTKVSKPDETDIQYLYDEPDKRIITYRKNSMGCVGNDYLLIEECSDVVNANRLGLMTGKIDENGNRAASWYYDSNENAYRSERGVRVENTQITRVSEQYLSRSQTGDVYASGQRVRDIVSPSGARTRMYFKKGLGQSHLVSKVEVYNELDELTTSEAYTYVNAQLVSKTDLNGLVTEFEYDGNGNVRKRTENAGTDNERVTTTTWTYFSPIAFKPTKIISPEIEIVNRYERVNSGILISESIVRDLETDNVRSTKYYYNENGLVSSIDGPRVGVSDITFFEYDAKGLLTKTTNALGHETKVVSYTEHGHPTAVIGENGVVTEFRYDTMGRLTSISRSGTSTLFEYDLTGKLTRLIKSNGSELNYEYDEASRLISISDANGNRINYELDGAGNVLQVDIKGTDDTLLQTQRQVYDEFDRLISVTNATQNKTSMSYLINGQLDKTIDAAANVSSNTYDTFQRLKELHDNEGEVTTFGYDSAGRTTSVTDATGKSTTYKYNGFGEMVERISPDTGVTTYTYDEAGNIKSETNALGITVSYTYDAINRLVTQSLPDSSENITYGYDDISVMNDVKNYGIGRLTSVSEGAGPRSYRYNENGQLIEERYSIGPQSYKLSYQYNAAKQLTAIVYPSGRVVNYSYHTTGQSAGNIVSISSTKAEQTHLILSNVQYLPFGPVTGFEQGNGISYVFNYDRNYRLTSYLVDGISNPTLKYSPISNIDSIDDPLDTLNDALYSYDKNSRLKSATNSLGNYAYEYDGIGNRQSKSHNGVTQTYEYAADSHRLTKVSVDAAIDVTPPINSTFNQAGRVASVSKNETRTDYLYNYLSQRVGKSSFDTSGENEIKSSEIQYHHDQQGLLIAESDGEGKWLKEYIYLHGKIVGFVDYEKIADGKLPVFFVTTDHLGTPYYLTDEDKQIVWKSKYSPFGLARVNADSDNDGQSIEFNLRFPGQYWDQETGLHYNWHRYYDPKIGRYITSDPIGLGDGVNTYGYVGGNPISWFDPMGLTRLVHDVEAGTLTVYPEIEGRESYAIDVTSGRGECENDTSCEFKRNEGPLPRGKYYINSDEIDNPSFWDDLERNFRTPRELGGGDWGDWRVRIYPRPGTVRKGRTGFYLHGGYLDGSAGCIDFGGLWWGNDRLLNDLLIDPDGLVPLLVK